MLEKYGEVLAVADALAMQSIDNVTDDETAGHAVDLIKQINEASKEVEKIRKEEKEPYLTKCRLVDGFFGDYTTSLASAKAKTQKPLDVFARKKAEEERKRLAEEAERKRLEAEKLAAEASTSEQLDEAVKAEDAAKSAETASTAKASDLSVIQGSGVSSSLRTRWVGEITDKNALDLEKLRHYIPADALQKALNAYVKDGHRELSGAKIYEEMKSVVR